LKRDTGKKCEETNKELSGKQRLECRETVERSPGLTQEKRMEERSAALAHRKQIEERSAGKTHRTGACGKCGMRCQRQRGQRREVATKQGMNNKRHKKPKIAR